MRTEEIIGRAIKGALIATGSLVGARTLFAANQAVNYVALGQWMKMHGMKPQRTFMYRAQLFRAAAEDLRTKRVLYTEFGVAEGYSLRQWCGLLDNPQSSLHGFDSFEGLPEDWSPLYAKGHFSRDGIVPETKDPRVKLFKGWFEDTLPTYVPPEHDALFVNIDSDLYSSAKTVLQYLGNL